MESYLSNNNRKKRKKYDEDSDDENNPQKFIESLEKKAREHSKRCEPDLLRG